MWPFNKAKAPAPRIHIIEPKPQSVNVKRVTGGALRQGMWIKLVDRVGILKEMNEFGVATVALTDERGFTTMEIPVPVGELTQAKLVDIPAARLAAEGAPSPAELQRMGYL